MSWLTMSEAERKKLCLEANVGKSRLDDFNRMLVRVGKKARLAGREATILSGKVGASVWDGTGGIEWRIMGAQHGVRAWRKLL